MIHQGDILKIGNIKYPVLVVSKDFFNETELIIGCPVLKDSTDSPLHIYIDSVKVKGAVHCEDMKLIDTRVRGYSVTDHINTASIMDITDAIQSIFDYI